MDSKLKLHCSLDKLLNGGVERGIVTEIYGEGGSGKTNICIQAAKSCIMEGKKVVYIDTEGVSKERLLQIFKEGKNIENILFFFPYSLSEQENVIKKGVKIEVGLLILDSANLFYRLELNRDESKATRSLSNQLVILQIEARKKGIPVIVTSQVYSAGGEIKPFAGRSMDHVAKTIIRTEKIEGEKDKGKEGRRAIIIKHRSIPKGKMQNFFITNDGIE